MTREIKFRGRRADNGEWVYGIPIQTHIGYFVVYEENPHVCSEYGYMEIDGFAKVDPSTIGQYTGLKDKNGVEIYEGDKVTIKGAVSATVEWNNFGFHLYGLEDVSGRRPDYAFSDFNQIEVIGNIHDKRKEEFK